MQHVAPGPGEGAHVAGLLLALEGSTHFGGLEAGVYRNHRLLVREENPVPLLLRQVTPWRVDVVAERHEDVALVLTLPGDRPRRHGALANGQRWIQHHRLFRGVVDPAETMTPRAGAFRRVRREGLGV